MLASADAKIEGTWEDGSSSVPFLISNEGLVGDLRLTYPAEGGNLRLIADQAVLMQSLNLSYTPEPGTPDSLVQGASPEPFQFFLNNFGRMTLMVLGTPLSIEGEIELDISVLPRTPVGSIGASWGGGFASQQNIPLPVVPVAEIPETDSLPGDFDSDEIVGLSDADLLVSAIASAENNLDFDLELLSEVVFLIA